MKIFAGEILQIIRKKKGIDQATAGHEALHIDERSKALRAMQQIEHSSRTGNEEAITQIAHYLKVNPDYIIDIDLSADVPKINGIDTGAFIIDPKLYQLYMMFENRMELWGSIANIGNRNMILEDMMRVICEEDNAFFVETVIKQIKENMLKEKDINALRKFLNTLPGNDY
ncbi:MAG: helix-turn-helix domain-containing protein [Proteobacteria bacterium]|nr:helix-turn-helix domain-containing protein [Pseudomonadota bacterium]